MQQSKTGIFYLTISKQNLFHIANYFVEMNISLRITFELQDKKPVKKEIEIKVEKFWLMWWKGVTI